MGFLSSSSCVNITVWMYHKDADKMHREKAQWKLLKNVTSYIEQNLEATPHKITAVQPFTFHF